MRYTGDRKFGWIAALAVASGAAVMLPSLAALVVAVGAALIAFF